MQERVWFYLFDVREMLSNREPVSLEDTLQTIHNRGLGDRTLNVNGTRLRVEALEERDSLWVIDFTKLRRTRGPGRAGRNTPAQGFRLSAEEDFSEATAMLYDRQNQLAVLEYNHHGVRRGTILSYLTRAANWASEEVNAYEFFPRFDDHARQRFERRRTTRKVRAMVHPRELNEQDYRQGGMLRDAVRQGIRTESSVVEVSVSVGRAGRSSILGGQVNADVEEMYELAKNEHDGLSHLEVHFENEDRALDSVDLVTSRTKTYYHLPVRDTDRQIPREERWGALERAWRGWT
jgi:hypothetical protein